MEASFGWCSGFTFGTGVTHFTRWAPVQSDSSPFLVTHLTHRAHKPIVVVGKQNADHSVALSDPRPVPVYLNEGGGW